MGQHTVWRPETVSNKYAKHFRGTPASSQLGLPFKILKWHVYKLQLVQKTTHKDHDSRRHFALIMLTCIEEYETYLDRLMRQHFMCV
jgi:hypothetical protein